MKQTLLTSLESAIRQSDHSLSDEEKEFLSKSDEAQDENADWLAKLDYTVDDTISEAGSPAIKVDLPEEDPPLEETKRQNLAILQFLAAYLTD